MIMKESTSAAWLAQTESHLAKLKQKIAKGLPVFTEARELSAAANILCEELMHENAKVGK